MGVAYVKTVPEFELLGRLVPGRAEQFLSPASGPSDSSGPE